jgi:hypothetical protein
MYPHKFFYFFVSLLNDQGLRKRGIDICCLRPFARRFSIFLLPALPLIILGSISLNNDTNNNNLQNIAMATTNTITNISKHQENKSLVPDDVNSTYVNTTYGIKIQYPPDWKLVEYGNTNYHMLNVVAEFLLPEQNSYYDPNIPASHNSLRLSVENYSNFEDAQQNNIIINSSNSVTSIDNQLQNIGNNRIGSIGISCPGFDLTSYNRNATLAGSSAYQIALDYTYLDDNKKATEIWTIKDNRVYIINYVANEDVYDRYVPVVQSMIDSFETTNFASTTTPAETTNSDLRLLH